MEEESLENVASEQISRDVDDIENAQLGNVTFDNREDGK
jgi:hypothetical protein